MTHTFCAGVGKAPIWQGPVGGPAWWVECPVYCPTVGDREAWLEAHT